MANTDDKIAQVQSEIDARKQDVEKGIALAIDRGDQLENIDNKAQNLADEAHTFQRQARKARWKFCREKWTMIALIAFILLVIIGIIVGVSVGTSK